MIKWILFVYWFSRNYNIIRIDTVYARQFKNRLENLGIMGIKFGQYICSRTDITTDIMKQELQIFLSENKLHSMNHTMMILNKAKINNIIIEDVIGSGSLTQVYRCRLPAYSMNDTFVLKVKHPDVCKIKYEISALKYLLKILSCFNRFKLFINVDWNNFFMLLETQLDLNNEKKFMEKYYSIYNNNKNEIKDITIPRYIVGNEDFIIMTYCEGKPLNTYPRDSIQYRKAMILFGSSTMHTFYKHMIIHGDIHEGNILVRDDGSISIIDFGICIELNDDECHGIYALSNFANDPTYNNIKLVVYALAQSLDIYNNIIDIDILSQEIYDMVIKIDVANKNNNKRSTINNTFNIVVNVTNKYNVLIKSNILLYFMNIALTESLSPFIGEEKLVEMSLVMLYMKNNKYFVEECEHFLDDYYKDSISYISKEILEKYIDKNANIINIR